MVFRALAAGAFFIAITCAQAATPIPEGYQSADVTLKGYAWQYVGPGCSVDVIRTFDGEIPDGRKEKQAELLFQDILVLDVEVPVNQGQESIIHLALKPGQIQQLDAAVQGQNVVFTVILRRDNDHKRRPKGKNAKYRELFK